MLSPSIYFDPLPKDKFAAVTNSTFNHLTVGNRDKCILGQLLAYYEVQHTDKPVCIFFFVSVLRLGDNDEVPQPARAPTAAAATAYLLPRFPSGASMPKSCLSCRRRDQTIRKIQDA